MERVDHNTVIVRLILGGIGTLLLGVLAFIGASFSGELKELQKGVHTSKERLAVVETMVDNIRDDTQEIKEDVKATQQQIDSIDTNIDDLKTLIMDNELKRMREARDP